jgi:hypothetical protein
MKRHQLFTSCVCVLSFLFVSAAVLAEDLPKPRFEAQKIDDISIGYGLAIGDVDGDGKKDILLADKKQFVWYRNPDWKKFVMVENLTQRDNVCLAAHDIDGDGKVEVAVGAQWNPGNTTDAKQSGSVHYLVRPDDPTKRWTPIQLHNEPTVHRMRWVRGESGYRLVVLPLHGRGNKGGKGEPVKILAYEMPKNPKDEWKTTVLDETLHVTHNFDVRRRGDRGDFVIFTGKEGIVGMSGSGDGVRRKTPAGMKNGAGEIRMARMSSEGPLLISTIEPFHGSDLVVYAIGAGGPEGEWERTVLDTSLSSGHALALSDLLGIGRTQVVAAWRSPNKEKKVGVRLYVPTDSSGTKWTAHDIDVKANGDKSGMACEDLRVADLDGDGKPDIVAAGRATKNLKIYWNKTGAK